MRPLISVMQILGLHMDRIVHLAFLVKCALMLIHFLKLLFLDMLADFHPRMRFATWL